MAGKQRITQEEQFWSKVQKTESCWLWQGAVSKRGYGYFNYWVGNGQPASFNPAHRFSWTLAHGPILNGLFVCHHCDTPRCVNPDHLFLGTNRDNMIDCVNKGRHNKPKGMNHWKHKLTDIEVIAIRQDASSARRLAETYGVSPRTILRIKHRRMWKHVP